MVEPVPEPMPTPSTGLRLRRHADFQLVYKHARKQYAKEISFFFSIRDPSESGGSRPFLTGGEPEAIPSISALAAGAPLPYCGPRIGLTVGKVLGKAHDRNRIKRRLRAAVWLHAGFLAGLPVDIILHPRRTVLTQEWPRLQAEVAQIFRTVLRKVQDGPPAVTHAETKAGAARNQRTRNSSASASRTQVKPRRPNAPERQAPEHGSRQPRSLPTPPAS